jgi:hypothetical protein
VVSAAHDPEAIRHAVDAVAELMPTASVSAATCVKSATHRRASVCATKSQPIRPPLRFAAGFYPAPAFRAFAIGDLPT